MLRGGFEHLPIIAAALFGAAPFHHGNHALFDRQTFIRDDQIGIDLHFRSETLAGWTRAMRIVERERAWFDLRQTRAVEWTGEVFGVKLIFGLIFCREASDHDGAATQAQRRLNRIGQARGEVFVFIRAVTFGFNDQTIHDRFNRVHLVAVEFDLFFHIAHRAVDAHPRVACFANFFKDVLMMPFAISHDRREDHELCSAGQSHDRIYNLLRRLSLHFAPALGAVRDADAGIEQTHVIINFGDSSNG